VRDRSIVVRQLIDTQMILLAREAKILQRDDVSIERKMDGLDRMFRILETAVAQPSDREFLEELMIEGSLQLPELLSFVTSFNQPADGPVKPKVRRGRAPVQR
jgi:hypothetical protein